MPDRTTIAVVGATDARREAVVRMILNDPDGGIAARVLTRDVNGVWAREFARLGAEVVAADINNAQNTPTALMNAVTLSVQ